MDPFTLIAIARGASEYVPGLARWLAGDRAGDVAQKVIDVAKDVTGAVDPARAMAELQANADAQIKLQQAMAPVVIAEFEAETRRLEAVNATMRAEVASGDKYVARWRPTLGYVVTLVWGAQMLAVSWLILANPEASIGVIAALAGLSVMWSVALAVLGIGVNARSRDKQVAAGQELPPGILGAIAARISGGKAGG